MNYDHGSALKQKIETLVQEKQMLALYREHTDPFKKHIKQKIYIFKLVTDRHQHKYIQQIKTPALKLNAMIKVHKDNKPIRPIFTSIHGTSSVLQTRQIYW
jgi:hypothetical protein